jgi:hypothetical protein
VKTRAAAGFRAPAVALTWSAALPYKPPDFQRRPADV